MELVSVVPNKTIAHAHRRRKEENLSHLVEILLMLLGIGVLITGVYASSFYEIRFDKILISSGILVFMTGGTVLMKEHRVRDKYVLYAWLIAASIVGTLLSVSIFNVFVS